ncbi:cyclophilin-like fold protein [Bacteroides sp. AN502(2024)]|uniref:cyclophilin-like fold protein n=1 Tax=Bacteroides sp. AN502(2024) TaxID=3160599 RepID=UPI003516A50D
MNKCMIVLGLLLMTIASVQTACGTDDDPITEKPATPVPNPEGTGENDNSESGNDNKENNDNENNEGENKMNRNIIIHVGNRGFAATLEDNATARAFSALLPMTITMNEMNSNEKYHYLSESLPTDSYRPGTIRNGDLMLYGSSCVVLFYETFASPYSYTRIGQLNDPSGLASALGRGNVPVTFEINND